MNTLKHWRKKLANTATIVGALTLSLTLSPVCRAVPVGWVETDSSTLTSWRANIRVYVDRTAPEGGDGSSWAHAFRRLESALAVEKRTADDKIEIWVARGTYTRSIQPNIIKEKKVYGGFSGTETYRRQRDIENNKTVLTSEKTRIVYVGPNAVLDGFTFKAYSESRRQSVLLYYGTGIYIRNCSFEGVQVDHGNSRVEAGFENCVFSSMTSDMYAFVRGAGTGTVELFNCTFNDNAGGAIYWGQVSGELTLNRCTFVDNGTETSCAAGAITLHSPAPFTTIRSCQFVGNRGSTAGAIWHRGSGNGLNLVVCNSLFVENYGVEGAGAIYLDSNSDTILSGCTIARNYSDWGSGGVYCDDSNGGTPLNDVYNTILWENVSSRPINARRSNVDWSSGYSLYFDTCVVEGWTGDAFSWHSVADWDPMFRNPDELDFSLRRSSPCIDAGDNSLLPFSITYDVVYQKRHVDCSRVADTGYTDGSKAVIDIGAYERQEW